MNEAKIDCGVASCSVERRPVAMDICDFASALAERIDQVNRGFANRLEPITTSPEPQEDCGTKGGREYPPLFEDLQSNFLRIESALNSLENILSRVEV